MKANKTSRGTLGSAFSYALSADGASGWWGRVIVQKISGYTVALLNLRIQRYCNTSQNFTYKLI